MNSHNNIPFRFAGTICINDHETFYWYREEREKLLTGTGVVEAVNRDIKKILKEFQTVVSPYLKKHKGTIRWSFTDLFLNNTPFHPECVYSDLKQAVLEDSSHHKKKLIYFEKAELWLESIHGTIYWNEIHFIIYIQDYLKWIVFTCTWSESCDDLELYKRMVSYVMAYSFTEPPKDDDSEDFGEEEEEEEKSTIYMVPMADMLNHIANNNAHLSFKPDCLEMVATKDIKKVYSLHVISVHYLLVFYCY